MLDDPKSNEKTKSKGQEQQKKKCIFTLSSSYMNEQIKPRQISIKIALIYFIIGGLWILFSDRLVNIFYDDKETIARLSLFKGWMYIIVTAVLLYVLIVNHMKRIHSAEMKLSKSYEELKVAYEDLEKAHEDIKASKEELGTQYLDLQDSQKALAEGEERYRLIIEGVNDGIWDLDVPRGIIFNFTRTKEMLGFEDHEIENKTDAFFSLVHKDDIEKVRTKIDEHFDKVSPYYICEYRIRTKNGDYKWFLSRGKAIWDHEGKPIRMAGSNTDITERKRAENEILQLNLGLEQRVVERTSELNMAIKEIESFSYSVSHDLRAPVRSIDGFSQILWDNYSDNLDEKGHHYLKRILTATKRMGKLIDELLNLSKLGRSEINCEQVNISNIVKTVCEQLKESEPERDVDFIIAEDISACCDKQLMQAVFENLVGNAWKFSSKHTHARIEFGILQQEQKTVYFLKDDGAGFDMFYKEKLFKPFQRLHRVDEFEGNGIGLANVYRIIRKHGGKLWAESKPEEGATFFFTIEKKLCESN